MKLKTKILIFGIALAVVLPWLNKAFKFIPNPNLENRSFAKFPQFDKNKIDEYPLQIDTFVSDNFSLRASSMKVYGLLNLYAFKKSPLPESVYFGKEGWMFYAREELGVFNGSLQLSNEGKDSMVERLQYRKNYLDKKGIEYYLFVVPVKNVLYADKQTDALLALQKKNRTDYFMEHVKQAIPDLNLYYLKEDLLEARKKENNTPLYWKTDNHWNRLGASYAVESILKRLKEDGHKVNLLDRKVYQKDSIYGFYGNLSYYTGLKGVVKEWDYKLTIPDSFQADTVSNYPFKTPRFAHDWEYQRRYKNKDTSLAKILYIRDSFGSDMMPLLAENSGESLYIFDNWEYGLNKHWVDTFQPDIVVHIVLERYLDHINTKTPFPDG